MSGFRAYLMMLSLLVILVISPGAMTTFMHYMAMLELYARFNPLATFVFGGIVWTATLTMIAKDYWTMFRPKQKRYWVIDEKYLEEYNGFYEGAVGLEKPVVVEEADNE